MFLIFKNNKKRIKYFNHFVIKNEDLLTECKKGNRDVLNSISSWISLDNFKNSYFNYGVPNSIMSLLDLPLGDEMTYTDLISYITKEFKNNNYLEIGVSVGKNFYQLANQFENARLTGFDIENINPILEKQFVFENKSEWTLNNESLRSELATLNNYNYKSNSISYLAGDIWDESCWQKLGGQRYNIIFSDALHDPKALLWEYDMIKKYELLADEFIFIWDDLNNGLEESFKRIVSDLTKNKNSEFKSYLIKINGWLGENYPLKHDVGILTNYKIK